MASDTRSNNQWSKVSTNLFIAASLGTSFVEAATLYPFEVIKTRQQVSLALLLSRALQWCYVGGQQWIPANCQ